MTGEKPAFLQRLQLTMRYLKANIYYIAPIAIWFVFYGFLLTNPGPFAKLFLILLVLRVAPYIIL
jgi:hypothetical protein